MEFRQTSLEAFQNIKDSGLLSKMRLLTFEVLAKHGKKSLTTNTVGLTAHELREFASKYSYINNTESLPKRLSELERMGCVVAGAARECGVKGNNAIEWRISGNMPTKLPKKAVDKNLIDAAPKLLEALQKIVHYHSDAEIIKGHKLGNTIPFIEAKKAIKAALGGDTNDQPKGGNSVQTEIQY